MTPLPSRLMMLALTLTLLSDWVCAVSPKESKWCSEKRAECETACGAHAHGRTDVDFHCRDAQGAREVSCSCMAGVRFGSGVVRSGSGSWWPAWFGAPAARARAPADLAPLGVGDESAIERLADIPVPESPGRTITLALAAGGATLAGLGAAGLVFLIAKVAFGSLPPSGHVPAGAACAPATPGKYKGLIPSLYARDRAAASLFNRAAADRGRRTGLDLEAADADPDAVALKSGTV